MILSHKDLQHYLSKKDPATQDAEKSWTESLPPHTGL